MSLYNSCIKIENILATYLGYPRYLGRSVIYINRKRGK